MRWMVGLTLVGCAPEELPTCDGTLGEPLLQVGAGPRDAFVPRTDDATLSGSGSGLEMSLWTTGLDTTMPVTTVVRISVGGGATTDSIAQLTYQCDEEIGHGWTQVTAVLPVDASDGDMLEVSVSTTDHLRTNAAVELTGALSL